MQKRVEKKSARLTDNSGLISITNVFLKKYNKQSSDINIFHVIYFLNYYHYYHLTNISKF